MTPTPKEQREALCHCYDRTKGGGITFRQVADKYFCPKCGKEWLSKDAQIAALQLEVVAAREALEEVLNIQVSEAVTNNTLTLFTDADKFAEKIVKAKQVIATPSPAADAVKKKLEAGEKLAKALKEHMDMHCSVTSVSVENALAAAKEAGIEA